MGPMSATDPVTNSLGAYLLGALLPAEHADVEQHLEGCSTCRLELSALAGLPRLLASLDATDVQHLEAAPAAPDEQLLDRILMELARRRRAQRRYGRVFAAAIIVAVLSAAAFTALRASEHHESAYAHARMVSATNTRSGVQAVVAFQRQPWGTSLHLALRGVPPGTRCELIAVLADGRRQTAGAWRASYEGTASIDAATDARPDHLDSVEVVTRTGTTLVTVPLRTG